jgi:hypothetical protein
MRYGRRLMLEFIVPEPAACYLAMTSNRPLAGVTLPNSQFRHSTVVPFTPPTSISAITARRARRLSEGNGPPGTLASAARQSSAGGSKKLKVQNREITEQAGAWVA